MLNNKMKRISNKLKELSTRYHYKRECRVYCVGAAKTGTHSIAEIFENSVRASHEPESDSFIEKILEFENKELTEKQIKKYIQARDKRLCLDIDSSQLNYFLMEQLQAEFNDAKFILTYREPREWLESFINDSLRRTTTKQWVAIREHRFQHRLLSHPAEEEILKKNGLYTLDGYLSYWADHNKNVLQTIHPNKLFTVKTKEIGSNLEKIADFIELPEQYINHKKSHAFKNTEKFGILEQLDQDYLNEKIEFHKKKLKGFSLFQQ
ncbi:sulfotransferase [Salinimonas lutimaris]|uniref:sulfotransferase n=1 Tax=Salinimonas lutimaris TaxID=914153 RepID=UPI0010C050ED|nr:sulfotransferase [Salinimonas lutimaris]